jgi:heptosyltransferase I
VSPIPPWTGGRLGIVMMSALGDAVRVLPLLDAIKRHALTTHITWVLQPAPAELVRGHSLVDDWVIFRRDRGLKGYLEVRRELATRTFDLVLNPQIYFKAGVVTSFTRAPVKLGFDFARTRDFNWLFTTHRIPPRPSGHVQDMYLEFLDAIGVPRREDIRWHLGPTLEERQAALRIVEGAVGPLVGLVIASTGRDRCWYADRWAEVATALRAECAARCVMLGGRSPYEVETAERIASLTDAAPINALGSGLRVLLGLLDACDLIIAPDTGPLHMAVAMEVPVVGLYGYTNPKRAGPFRKYQDILVDRFGDPGEDYSPGERYRPGRMRLITSRDVIEKAKLGLERYAGAGPWRRGREPRGD